MLDTGSSASSWLPAAITAISSFGVAIAGFLTMRILDTRKDERTYQREKAARDDARRDKIRERRNEFQRQTLLDLQQEIRQLIQSCTKYTCRHWETDDWRTNKLAAEEAMRTAYAETNILVTRIHDSQIRELMEALKKQLLLAERTQEYEQRRLSFLDIAPILILLNDRIGEVFRPGAPSMRSHLAHGWAATNSLGHPQLHQPTSTQRRKPGAPHPASKMLARRTPTPPPTNNPTTTSKGHGFSHANKPPRQRRYRSAEGRREAAGATT